MLNLKQPMYQEKTHAFTLGILCDSWNWWDWHLWFSSGANWISRCWEMARIKVNKTEGQLSMDPGRKHVKFRRVWTVNWLVGSDIQVLEVTSVSKLACCWIRKKATLFVEKNLHRRYFHIDQDGAGSRNVQKSYS